MQVGGAADAGQLAALAQQVGHGDRVGRLTPAVQLEYGLVHDLVRGPVVVIRPDGLHHIGDRVLGQQHPAEYALLGRHVMRWGAVEASVPGSDLGNAHPIPPPR